MVDKLKETMKKIPAAWQVGTLLIAIFLGGAALSGWIQLPSEMSATQETLEFVRVEQIRNFSEHSQINSRLDKILCNQNPDMTWDQCELAYGGRSN